jgi:GT2 family glycosyltransferase
VTAAAGTGPALSILVPTYQRDGILWDTVRKLRMQMRPEDEIVVVDQNRPPLRLPGDLDGRAGRPIRLVRLPAPSLTRARNLALETARHPLALFLDDDIEPDPALLDALRRAAAAHPDRILTGVIEQRDKPAGVAPPGWIDFDTGEIRTDFSRPVTGEIPFFPGGLALIPRSCLPPRPWFCPAFRGASQGEEIDFALRARRRGVRIRAEPSIRIFHLKAENGGCRAPDFRRRFFLDHVFNQALFFGRHCRYRSLPRFLGRMRGFVEYHTRREGGKGHAPGLICAAGWALGQGLLAGMRLRIRD